MRIRLRSRLKTSIKEYGNVEACFTRDAIDFRGARGSTHLDWTPIKWARRIPEGAEVCIGNVLFFFSRSYFADGDFDRFLELLRFKLGARAKV